MAFQPIDELVVEIKTRSTDASPQIDALVNSLAALKVAVKGGAGLTTVSNQFTKFANALNSLPTDSNSRVAKIVDALKPLETIGKSNLGSALNQLKKIPEITKSLDAGSLGEFANKIQQVTIAVKPLADEMNKVSMGFSKLPANIQKAINANARLTKSNKSTAFGFTMLAAKIGIYLYAIRRVSRVLAGWIKESNDYVENLNLFHVAMGKYADEAQKYAVKVSDVLGIDPSEFMRYQAVFQNMATGFGVTGDKAAIMSKNLTQLGYDLASVFNVKFDVAMEKLESALAGQPRPMREWGFDLSEATLKTVALGKGIKGNVEKMTQLEKSQLRYVQLIETAQRLNLTGDLARTLQAPANQLRVLKAQAIQAARALGNIFIPALNAVLPYAIAFLKVIRWVATEIANLFGFTLPEIDYSSIGKVGDVTGELEDELGNANGAAKELQKTLFGFDQLNLMKAPVSSSGGSGGTIGGGGDLGINLPEYDFLGDLTETKVAAIFDKWKKDAEPFVNFLVDNFDWLSKTALAIGGILLAWKVTRGLSNFINSLSRVPLLLGGGVLAGIGAAGLVFSIEDIITEGLNKINFSTILGSAGTFTGGAALIGKFFGSTLLGGAIGGIIAGAGLLFAGLYDALKNGIDWLSAALIPLGATAMGASIGAIIGMLGGPIGAGIGALIGLAVGAITDLTIWIVQNWDTVKKTLDGAVKWVNQKVIQPVFGFFSGLFSDIQKKFSPITNWFKTLFQNSWNIVKAIWMVASDWFGINVIDPIVGKFNAVKDKVSLVFSLLFGAIKSVWSTASAWFYANVTYPLINIFSIAWDTISSGFMTSFNNIANFAKTIFNSIIRYLENSLNSIVGGFNKLIGVFNDVSKWASNTIGVQYNPLPRVKTVSLPRFAGGGFVGDGELFIARESGPEMVGRIGGGTAVANNDQIVEAVSRGVAEAVRSSMGSGGDVNVYIDGVLTKSVSAIERKNTRAGRTVIPVGV